MTKTQPFQDDLRFVREVVERRSAIRPFAVVAYYVAAIYVLIGYALLDINQKYAGYFFILGLIPFSIWTVVGARRAAARTGEIDRARSRRHLMHWGFGIWGSMLFSVALAWVIPALRGPVGGQVMLVMFGMVYLLWGVHVDPRFLMLGPILMIAGVCVRFIPHYPWTCIGTVIALGLVAAGILAKRSFARKAADTI
jgi:hypothetical protein